MCSPPETTYQGNSQNRKLTFARLATYVLNVERSLKKSVKSCREEDLLDAAETGNLTKLRWLLESNGDLNTEHTDQLGRTPLHLAVVNEHKEVVRHLLDHVGRQCFQKALLAAINIGNEEIAELLIEHPRYSEIKQETKNHVTKDDQFFDEEVTPLILAAQQDRFEVVMALLLKEERILKPHRSNCPCETCFKQTTKDELKFARSRLNAYRGLASESYISLSSEDPILTSFKLRKELQQIADEEKYYAAEYLSLANQLSEYAVKLLDQVHGNDELNSILNVGTNEEEETNVQLPRLQLAIKYKEKSCQMKLTSLWYQYQNSSFMNRSNLLHTAIIFVVIIFFPFLSLLHIISPNSKASNFMRTPCIKFIFNAASYLIFLLLIIVQGQAEQSTLCRQRFFQHEPSNVHLASFSHNFSGIFTKEINNICLRNHQPVAMEMYILLWILGMLVNACQQIHRSGFKDHFMNVYNAMDFFMLSFYLASFVLKRITEQLIKSSLDFFSRRNSWLKLLERDIDAMYKIYWLDADRYYWDSWDPTHMCEALFAVGNIINFARLFHLLSINEHLGPMLISLERMIKDVMKFMVTFVPIFLAFMVGMYNLYWYYDPQVRKVVENPSHNIQTRAQDGFGSLELTFRTTFWALFGLKDARTVELGEGFKSRLTESVGYIVFGVYNWGAVIVLLNMLIAMMTRSFDKIATDQDIEWKYVRSRLYLDYINDRSSFPVPFNILLVPIFTSQQILSCIKSCREFVSHDKHVQRDRSMTPLARRDNSTRFQRQEGINFRNSIKFHQQPPTINQNQNIVVKSIVRRYIFDRLLACVAASDGSGTSSSGLKQQIDSVKETFQLSINRLSDQLTKVTKDVNFHKSP